MAIYPSEPWLASCPLEKYSCSILKENVYVQMSFPMPTTRCCLLNLILTSLFLLNPLLLLKEKGCCSLLYRHIGPSLPNSNRGQDHANDWDAHNMLIR